MKLVVLDGETLALERDEWSALAGLGEVVWFEHTPHEPTTIVEHCAGADVVLTNKVPFSRDVLRQLPDLKLISILATGFNIIDLNAAADQGITVCNVPAYSTDAVAQHTLALILHATNHVALHAESVRAGDWIGRRQFWYYKAVPVELCELTIGLIGFGSIGRRVGEILQPLGPRILAHQRTPRDAPDWPRFAFASQEEILRQADIVSLHCPLTPETKQMIDGEAIARMRPGARLVNTARGGLVDEEALAENLRSGHLGGAWLDVVEEEPMQADNPLRTAPRCFITPHIAWASLRARRRLLQETIDNIAAFQKGSPRNAVSP